MSHRGRLAAFALTSLMVPGLAFAAIVQKWSSGAISYTWQNQISGDINGDGSIEMVTVEPPSGGASKIGIRSGSTGGLLTQTAGSYQPTTFWLANVDAGGDYEIIFSDALTGKINCLKYAPGALTSLFSYSPTPNGVPSNWEFVDFDGNSHLYLVFKDESPLSTKYYVRDSNGALVTTIDLGVSAPSGSGWTCNLRPDDYDNDGRQELMIDYYGHTPGSLEPDHSVLYVWESNAPGPARPAALQRTAPGSMLTGRRGGGPPSELLRLAPHANEPTTVGGSR